MNRERPVAELLARGSVLALILLAATAQTRPPTPDVRLTFDAPAYSFAATCDLTQPLAFVALKATNADTLVAPVVVSATDEAGTLAGAAFVPALASGASTMVSVPLSRVGSTAAASLGGRHVVSVVVRGRPTTLALELPFPASLCASAGPVVSTRVKTHAHANQTFSETETNAGRAAILASLTIAPPGSVRNVASNTECGAHVGAFGAFACPEMMKSGDLLLIWDWQPGDGPGDIDGYRIYTGNGYNLRDGSYVGQLIATRPNAGVTLFDVPKPSDGKGYAGRCYAITAYAGNSESKPSAPFCSGGDVGAKTVTLPPTRQLAISRNTYNNRENAPVDNLPSGYGVVGYNYSAVNGGLLADSSFAWISRYAILFDVKPLLGRRVVEAHATLNLVAGLNTRPDCTNSVGYGFSDWWNEGWPDGTFATPNMTLLGGQLKIDLTNAVSDWTAGRLNQGIILRSDDENLRAFTVKRCETRYNNPVLSVTYY